MKLPGIHTYGWGREKKERWVVKEKWGASWEEKGLTGVRGDKKGHRIHMIKIFYRYIWKDIRKPTMYNIYIYIYTQISSKKKKIVKGKRRYLARWFSFKSCLHTKCNWSQFLAALLWGNLHLQKLKERWHWTRMFCQWSMVLLPAYVSAPDS